MSFSHRVLILSFVITVLSSCKEQERPMTIAASANMQYVLDTLVPFFEKTHNIPCQVVTSSSGKLTTQILQGAPYDIFLSADIKYPQELKSKGITNDSVTIYASGRLALWSKAPIQTFKDLTELDIEHFAIASEATAPYGQSTVSFLRSEGLYTSLEADLILAESISQVNTFIATNSVDAAVTSYSSIRTLKETQQNYWKLIPTNLHPPIAQGLISIEDNERTQSFKKFLFSEDAQKILRDYGYLSIQ